ncbi:MAG: hypothetical protein Q9160_004753 [Pyrenula sp. 1 TL-2023]
MAEVLGAIASGVTLAALFKACVEAFDLIQASRNQEVDFKKLKLRLHIEKCRLYIWGDSMGLTDDTAHPNRIRLIDEFRFPEVVREILEVIFQLFNDSFKIRDKYGCRQATSDELLLEADQHGPISSLAASFSNFVIRASQFPNTSRTTQNIAWIIHDRKKFGKLVAEIKDLVDSLQGITSPSVPIARQSSVMRRKVANIPYTETLSLIAEVCSDDHPDIADVASTKADTLSSPSTHQRHVAAWTENVEIFQPDGEERMSPDVESLTVTELKHKVLEMYQERKEREMLAKETSSEMKSEVLTRSIEGSRNCPLSPGRSIEQTTSSDLAMTRAPDTVIWTSTPPISDPAPYTTALDPATTSDFSNPWENNSLSRPAYHSNTQATLGNPDARKVSPFEELTGTSSYNFPSLYQAQNTERIAIDTSYGKTSLYEADAMDASRGMIAFSQLSPTPHNFHGTGSMRTATDSFEFPRTSSVSSCSNSSHQGYDYYMPSASGSTGGDPTDGGSSVASDTGIWPGSSNSAYAFVHISPPKSMMGQFSSNLSGTQKKHKCKICEKRFTRPSSLQTHMYSHTGEKRKFTSVKWDHRLTRYSVCM